MASSPGNILIKMWIFKSPYTHYIRITNSAKTNNIQMQAVTNRVKWKDNDSTELWKCIIIEPIKIYAIE